MGLVLTRLVRPLKDSSYYVGTPWAHLKGGLGLTRFGGYDSKPTRRPGGREPPTQRGTGEETPPLYTDRSGTGSKQVPTLSDATRSQPEVHDGQELPPAEWGLRSKSSPVLLQHCSDFEGRSWSQSGDGPRVGPLRGTETRRADSGGVVTREQYERRDLFTTDVFKVTRPPLEILLELGVTGLPEPTKTVIEWEVAIDEKVRPDGPVLTGVQSRSGSEGTRDPEGAPTRHSPRDPLTSPTTDFTTTRHPPTLYRKNPNVLRYICVPDPTTHLPGTDPP